MDILVFIFYVGEVITLFDMSNSNLFPVSLLMDSRLQRVRPTLSSFIRYTSWRFLVIYIEHTSLSTSDRHKKIFHLSSVRIHSYLISRYFLVFSVPSWNHLRSMSLDWCLARLRRDYYVDGANLLSYEEDVRALSSGVSTKSVSCVINLHCLYAIIPHMLLKEMTESCYVKIADDPVIDGVDTGGLVFDKSLYL